MRLPNLFPCVRISTVLLLAHCRFHCCTLVGLDPDVVYFTVELPHLRVVVSFTVLLANIDFLLFIARIYSSCGLQLQRISRILCDSRLKSQLLIYFLSRRSPLQPLMVAEVQNDTSQIQCLFDSSASCSLIWLFPNSMAILQIIRRMDIPQRSRSNLLPPLNHHTRLLTKCLLICLNHNPLLVTWVPNFSLLLNNIVN